MAATGYVLGIRTKIIVDETNTIHRNSWMTELEIEELERKVTWSDSVISARQEVMRLCLIR